MKQVKKTRAARLWSLSDGIRRYGVIQAGDESRAWVIVRALQESGDFPVGSSIALQPSTTQVVRRIGRIARRAMVTQGFLACLGDGLFITQLGGLDLAPSHA